jgi:hypothetical protein
MRNIDLGLGWGVDGELPHIPHDTNHFPHLVFEPDAPADRTRIGPEAAASALDRQPATP